MTIKARSEDPASPITTAPSADGGEGRGGRDALAIAERAIEDGAVLLAYQPVVPAERHDAPAFYEGLIRVLDPNGRIIPAKDFIERAETSELGRRIDCVSLAAGLRVLGDNLDLRLSINMSARSITYPGWIETLERGLAKNPEVAERLILEITESSAILLPDLVATFMNGLQQRGVSFAIDDFGSGYTSMRYLKSLRFDILKIDGQFIRGIATCRDNQAMVKAIVSIARHFDMISIAEFVESIEDAQMLAEIGVDCLQGYYFGAPTVRPRWGPSPEACRTA